jgi:hypothetical protein
LLAGKELGLPLGHGGELGIGAVQGGARLEQPDGLVAVIAARFGAGDLERSVDVLEAAETEMLRQNATTVKACRRAGWSCPPGRIRLETIVPEPVVQHDHPAPARGLLVGVEEASLHGRHTQERKEVGTDPRTIHPIGTVSIREVVVAVRVRGEGKGGALLPPVHQVG